MIFRLVAGTIFATWLLWQFAVSSTAQAKQPEVIAFAAFPESVAPSDKPAAAVFYRRTGVGQYKAYSLDTAGQIMRIVSLPGNEIQKADQSSVKLEGKEGYITAPANGAYYIWYPQIGQQVYVFNEQGNFLWEKEESHYLHALPFGRLIMAAAGDHSRMIFMNPDFKTQADFQGVLFTRFVVDDNPEQKNAQVCLGSLDGEVIVAHIDRKVHLRQKLGYALKSLLCDFDKSELLAIVERTVTVDKAQKQVDFLLRGRFALKPPKEEKPAETMRQLDASIDITHTIELPVRTVMASPLVLADDSVCFLQMANHEENTALTDKPGARTQDSGNDLALYYTRGRSKKLNQMIVGKIQAAGDAAAGNLSPDLWKSAAIPLANGNACLFAHRSGKLVVTDHRGVLLTRNDLPVERLVTTKDAVYLQTSKGIFTLR